MTETLASQISQHIPRMYRVAIRLFADGDRAHDVVQEACLKAMAGIGSFSGHASMATWLHRITTNCARDALRSQRRREGAHSVLRSRAGGFGQQADPAAMVEKKELSDLARRLVEQLPDDCRLAFALTQLDGYSYDEAAEIEGRPRGTMASRVYRAKRILLKKMNAHIDGRENS